MIPTLAEKIPRPREEPLFVLANSRGKASLQCQMHLSRKEIQALTVSI